MKAKKTAALLLAVLRNNIVTVIAAVLAAVTCIIVPPDGEYLGYFDFKTLTCLFCVLAVVGALRNIRFFYTLAGKIVTVCRTARMSVLALVYITFLGSMLIANDMALLTFLPLGYFVLHTTKMEKYMAFTFIMQNIAANLGGMLTPFGNPQNLYLYSYFGIPDAEFILIMLPLFLLSVLLITLSCIIFVKSEPLTIEKTNYNTPVWRVIVYLILFALSVVIVFRLIPYQVGLIVIPLALVFLDRRALLNVDWGLLLTFAFFFVFSGNLSRIDAVRSFFESLLSYNVTAVSAISCQFISNVPTAILLARFTENYRELLMGVNIGGVGTIISSLASLITFREYTMHGKGRALPYLFKFSAFNFFFLAVLLAAAVILVRLY